MEPLAAEDLRVCTPTGDRWRAGELRESLHAALTHRPRGEIALVVLTTLATADPSSLDKLLVLLEASAPSFRFLLASPSTAPLPPQLLGRVTTHLEVHPEHLDTDRIAEHLGLDPRHLRAALPLLLESPALLAGAEKRLESVEDLARIAETALITDRPSHTAKTVLDALRSLPEAAALRQGVEVVLHHVETEVRRVLATRGTDGLAAFVALESSRAALRAGADPAVVLTAALWAASSFAAAG
jgi:hypothetical protein